MATAKDQPNTKRRKTIPEKQTADQATRGQGGRKISESDQGKKV